MLAHEIVSSTALLTARNDANMSGTDYRMSLYASDPVANMSREELAALLPKTLQELFDNIRRSQNAVMERERNRSEAERAAERNRAATERNRADDALSYAINTHNLNQVIIALSAARARESRRASERASES